jgi:CBS-domain-containing membrane protein
MVSPNTVESVMSTDVVTVTPEMSFRDVVKVLRRRRVSGLPVVNDAGKLVGIVSEADLLNKVEKRSREAYVLESRWQRLDRARAEALDVASVMSTDVITVQPDCPISLAAREMHTRGFKRLPVVDKDGSLVGIVSRGDLLTVFLRPDREVRADVRRFLKLAEIKYRGRNLRAQVSQGVVDLEGSFDERSRCDATIRAITATEGVIGVRSSLTFKVDDTLR